MAITTNYNTGFESGLVNVSGGGAAATPGGLADVINGTVSVTSSNPRTGTYSLLVGSGVNADHTWHKYFPATTRFKVMRFMLRVNTAPAAQMRVATFGTAPTAAGMAVRVTSALVLQVISGAATTDIGTLSLNTWHRIELQFDSSVDPNTLRGRIDGGTISAAGTLVRAASDTTMIRFGDTLTATGVYQYDDVVIGDYTDATNDWYGDGYGEKLLPGSDGSHSFTANDFSTGDAGTLRAPSYTDFYLMVDDPPPWTTTRSTTDNIAQRVVRAGYVEIAPATAPNKPTANGVQALLEWSSVTATANTAACIIRNSTPTETSIWGTSATPIDWSELTNFFKGAQVTKPAAGWTQAEISALRWRFGYSGDISPVPTAQAMMLEMDYPFVGIPDQNMAEWVPGRR